MKPIFVKGIVIALMVTFLFSFLSINASATTPTLKFEITKVGSTYYATNQDTMQVVSTSSNPSTVIQYALNHLTNGRVVQEKVLIHCSLTLTTVLTIPSYTYLELNGTVTMSNTARGHALTATGNHYITIHGGNWDGNQHTNPYGGSARDTFYFRNCHNVIVQNLTIHDAPYGNIEFYDCDYVTITNIESYDSGIIGASEAWRGLSIILENCSYSIVQNSYIHDSARGGVYFYCEDETPYGYVDKPETINYNIMRNNTVARTQCSGLSLSIRGTTDNTSYGIIENNTMIDCGRDGSHPSINVGFSETFVLNPRWGFRATIQYNTISATGLYNCGDGISQRGNQSTIRYNTIENTSAGGILVAGNNNIVVHNQVNNITRNGAFGIMLLDADYNDVNNNTIGNVSGSGAKDIWEYTALSNACVANSIRYNTIDGVGGYSNTNPIPVNNTIYVPPIVPHDDNYVNSEVNYTLIISVKGVPELTTFVVTIGVSFALILILIEYFRIRIKLG